MPTTTATPPATTVTTDRDAREIVIERTFDAPRELVFLAFSSCDHLAKWWGPREFSLSVCSLDFRPGGAWHYCFAAPDGTEACGFARLEAIEAPARIVYREGFADREGEPLEGMPVMLTTITLAEVDGRTTLRNIARFESLGDLDRMVEFQMVEGLSESFERLAEALPDLA